MTEKLLIENYNYELPNEKIATQPLPMRDSSKLLLWKDGKIGESVFSQLANEIPEGYSLVFNNTKVIRARLFFKNSTGALLEVFLLEPLKPTAEIQQALSQAMACEWLCFVSKPEKWRNENLISVFDTGLFQITLKAQKISRQKDGFIIRFEWSPPEKTFAQILETAGNMPLPPYMKRKSETADDNRYQTVFGFNNGSVAAPTASLHFSENLLSELKEKFPVEFVTLHVGAGTFKPVKTDDVHDHQMHAEKIIISKSCIENLCDEKRFGKIIAAGTTSLRTLETIYWWGVKCLRNEIREANLFLEQWYPYQNQSTFTRKESLVALLAYFKKNNLTQLQGQTELIIVPGYELKMVKGLITNFHQPRSTLLLLVAAFAGQEWKKMYDYALENNFRFLSYGDGSLLLK